jgi:hypothetical protein
VTLSIKKYMKKAFDYLKGKKTYIVGLLMIALGLLNGDNQLVLEGVGIMTLRAGIAKAGTQQ